MFANLSVWRRKMKQRLRTVREAWAIPHVHFCNFSIYRMISGLRKSVFWSTTRINTMILCQKNAKLGHVYSKTIGEDLE